MHAGLLLHLLVLVQLGLPSGLPTRTLDLPAQAKHLLTAQVGKWAYFNTFIPAIDSTQDKWDSVYADVVLGDFNNDSRPDYAALVRVRNPSSEPADLLVVLLRAGKTFRVVVVDSIPYDPAVVLYLIHKGERLYAYDQDKTITLPADGIEAGYYERSGVTYYFHRGKLFHFTSAD